MFGTIFKTKVPVHLILAEAAREFHEKYTQSLPVGHSRIQVERLEKLGLNNTQNYKIVKQRTEDFEKLQNLKRFISNLKGTNSFLISREKFEKILKKYKLSVGYLSDYCGVIPEKNLQEIETAPNVFTRLVYTKYRLAYIDTVEDTSITGEDLSDLLKYLDKNNNIVPIKKVYYVRRNNEWTPDDIYEQKFNLRFPNLVKLHGKYLDETPGSFMIACPKKYLNKTSELKISHNPVDPIVFQYCPFGVIIHSVWGEEAEDKTIQKYKEFNKLF